MKLTTIGQIKRHNANTGHHFFDPATMEFFGSRVHANVYPLSDGTALFVTSERESFDRDSRRRYTVRQANLDGTISTVGSFGEHRTADKATAVASHIARLDATPTPNPAQDKES